MTLRRTWVTGNKTNRDFGNKKNEATLPALGKKKTRSGLATMVSGFVQDIEIMDQSEEKCQLFQFMLEKARQIPHAENKRAAELEWRAAAVAYLSYGHAGGRQSPAPMQQQLIDFVNELVPAEATQATSGRAWS